MKCLLLSILLLLGGRVSATVYDVTNFGAKGDGRTDNTVAIQQTIDKCAADGGGQVLFPAGSFLTGTIILKSHVMLYLSAGSQIIGTTDLAKYPHQQHGFAFYGANWAQQSLIYAHEAEDVGIEGDGTIDGQGASFPITTDKKPDRYRNRPYLLWFIKCKRVRVSGVSLRNSAFWMQHYLGCDDVTINGINIWNHSNKNNDMMDIDGSRNVTIQNVKGDSDDDGLTLKSTSPLISENITITNCVLSSHCNALKLGTESTGGFRNVAISNCVIKPSAQQKTIYGKPAGNSGISLEMADGGVMENITITNIIIEGPQVPIFIRLGDRARKYDDKAAAPGVGKAKNISISHIIATGGDVTGCSISGIDKAYAEDISLDDISIEIGGGGLAADMVKDVPKLDDQYPEATMFGNLPAYGFYIAHIRNIRLNNIRFKFKNSDARPALALDDVKGFELSSIIMPTTIITKAAVYLKNSSDGLIINNKVLAPAQSFVAKNNTGDDIRLVNNYHPQIKNSISIVK